MSLQSLEASVFWHIKRNIKQKAQLLWSCDTVTYQSYNSEKE